jgi:tRNA pseudouridine32 synthase/23S rRNA pseudouridine746 synthase
MNILFQDDRFIVVDKPAGLPVHPGPRARASVEDHFPSLRFGRRDGPFLCHRLDADTSGCLLLARRKSALREANALFAAGSVDKTYWAIVQGAPDAVRGSIDLALAKHSDARGWRMVADAEGQRAVTVWRVLARGSGVAWLELRPRTGRTHQVRAHCALALGCPVLGDPVYGSGAIPRKGGPLMLLARAIALPTASPVDATAEPPPAMADVLATLKQAA